MNTPLSTPTVSISAEVSTKSPIPVDKINELYRGEIFAEETARVARDRIHWMCSQCVGDTVLDVGCSQGIASILLAREGFTVTAIDTHPDSVVFARSEFDLESPLVQQRLTLVQTDLASLPEQPSYDTIVLGEVIEHQARPDRLLRAAKVRLNTGGRLVVTTPFALHPHPDHKVSLFPRDLIELAREIDLAVTELKVDGIYMRCVMVEPEKAGAQLEAYELLRLTEAATLDAELRLFSRLDDRSAEINKKTEALRITQRKLTAALAELLQLRQKLESELSQTMGAQQAALKELQAASAETQARQALWAQQQQQLEGELSQATAAHQAALNELVIATAENQRLSALNQAQLESLQLELTNSFSNKLGKTFIEGIRSPSALAKLPFQLYSLWRKTRSRQPPDILGGESLNSVFSAYASGGFAAVESLMASVRLSQAVTANAYTALARYLRPINVNQACEAARLAYRADPQPFRRKWLGFRLNDAGKLSEADALLATLPVNAKLSLSEIDAIGEIRGRADDERKISSRAKLCLNFGGSVRASVEVPKKSNLKKSRRLEPKIVASLSFNSDNYYIEKCQSDGVDAVTHEILLAFAENKMIGSSECVRVAKALRDAGIADAEYPLMKAAKELHCSPATLRSFFWAAQREKRFQEACDAIQEIETRFGPSLSSDESQRLRKMKNSPSYQLKLRDLIVDKRPPIQEPVRGRICYVLHNSLPYSSGGYATRAQGVAGGLKKAGFEVIALTRPGFPSDTKPEVVPHDVPLSDTIDEIKYARIPLPLRKSIRCPTGKTIIDYVPEAADEIEKKLRDLNPQLVIAASNYFTSLPALIAARRLGIPFVYEVRGLWEITRMSRDPEFINTATFAVQSKFEATVCAEADRVFTLTGPMRDELVDRGVDQSKIALLPNSCDPDRFLPRERDVLLAELLNIPFGVPVIGYIGTFVDYEGLEDLSSACALLKQRNIEFRLLLVGNENASGQDRGPITEQIAGIANSSGFNDWLIMPGRIPHEEVEKYYSLIDIAPFPRKPLPVCEMVSPMKPLEAFAMEKAVVVSSVRALEEMVENERTGLIFDKGNVESLANVLSRLVIDADLRKSLGINGREWVTKQRTWAASTQVVTSYMNELSHSSTVIATTPSFPIWWQSIPIEFRGKCQFRNVFEWELSSSVKDLKTEYESRFGKDVVAKKIPLTNWQRADICSHMIANVDPLNVLDIGSGLGEFVNLYSSISPNVQITSIDVKDYALWFNHTGRIERIYKSIFDLGSHEERDVVTCFEVIEHLPTDRVKEAVSILRSLAKRKLFVSVPFMEPMPLSTGHRSRFEEKNLQDLFPDAKFTIFAKGGKSVNKVLAWIMCEIDCEAT